MSADKQTSIATKDRFQRYGSKTYILFCLFLVFTVLMLISFGNTDSFHPNTPAPSPKVAHPPISVHYFNRPPWYPNNVFSKCAHKCYLTGGRDFSKSDVVVFHTPYVGERHQRKKLGQIWVFHSQEPPWMHWCKFNNWKHEFNWTMTYRRDSDIMVPLNNFKLRTLKQGDWKEEMKTLTEKWKNKSNDIAWIVSHCRTAGKREQYVAKLRNITQVDIYGRCGDKKCPRSKDVECLSSYRFYLSFENQLCADYITEKSFKIYKSNMSAIPVTRGGSNYSMYLPPGSYIDSSKFSNMSQLHKYMNSLSSNVTESMKFMKWRKHYMAEREFPHHCELCRRLHMADSYKQYRRLYRDIGEWHRGDNNTTNKICRDPNHDIS